MGPSRSLEDLSSFDSISHVPANLTDVPAFKPLYALPSIVHHPGPPPPPPPTLAPLPLAVPVISPSLRRGDKQAASKCHLNHIHSPVESHAVVFLASAETVTPPLWPSTARLSQLECASPTSAALGLWELWYHTLPVPGPLYVLFS